MNHPTYITDVLICGAGPAGAGTALFLARKGIPHMLVDKASFPRDKVCGDALSGKVVEVFRKLDPSLVDRMDKLPGEFIPSWGVKFVAPNGKSIDIPFKQDMSAQAQAPGFIAKRFDFDHFLVQQLDQNHTQFIPGCKITGYSHTADGVTVSGELNNEPVTIQARMVIAADGNGSVFSRNYGHQLDPMHHCGGIRAYYNNVSGMHASNFIELHFLDEMLPGYFWIFPLPGNRANVGAGMLSQTLSRKKINLREAMLKAIKENPNIRDRFANATLEGKILGWGLPLGSKRRPLSADRMLFAGDAGSMIDPFTGEGIGNALVCGMLAADTIEQSLKLDRFDAGFLNRYDQAVWSRLGDELKLSHTMQRLCRYPWLFNFVVNKAERNKTLQETISCMFEDMDLRARLRKPSFYAKLLFGG